MKGISRWIKIKNFIKNNDKNYIEFAMLTKFFIFLSVWQKGFLLIERFY
jgi:hypothetical protein